MSRQAGPRVAIYVRVSTSEQSTDLQTAELREFAERRGWSSVTVYDDTGASGASADRPALKRLLEAAKRRQIDVVLIWKLDRLFRSLKNLVGTLSDWKELGVRLVSLKESLDLTTPSGMLLLHIIGAMGEFERELIRERVVAGLADARRRGKRLGRPRKRNDDAVLELRGTGQSIREIARRLGISKGSVQAALKAR